MDIFEIKKILKKNDRYIKTTFYVREIGIFGSFVKERQKTKSDIDILVAFEKGHKDFFNYMRLKYRMEQLLGQKVDHNQWNQLNHRHHPHLNPFPKRL